MEEEERMRKLQEEKEEQERLKKERERMLDEAWSKMGRALVRKQLERDRKWTFFILHFMRLTVNRRIAKVQQMWRQHKQ